MTAASPPIVTYVQAGGPRMALPWMARFVVTETDMRTKKRYLACLPLFFCALSEEGAHGAALQWWNAEQAKHESSRIKLAKAHEARRKRGEGATV